MAAADPPPATVEVPDYRPALGLLALAALALAAIFGRRLLAARRARQAAPPPPPPPRPPDEEALEALDALAGSGLAERGAWKDFFTELSFVIRRYVGRRYGVEALERTVDELSERLERLSTPGLERRALARVLFEAEQVKFARYTPPPEAGAEALAWARAMVEATRPGADGPAEDREGGAPRAEAAG
jgi:hypothetical protein